MIVDTSTWKPFCVGDLFDCETTLSVPSKNNLVDGDVSYITRSAVDNGLSGHCGNLDSVNVGRCITIGAEGFVAFWQPDDFVAGNKVYALRHSGLNELRALFVCAALNVLSSEYSFSNARILDSIKQEVILLPVTPDGEPNWAYMEDYMQQVLDREEMLAEHLASLTAEAVADGHVVDTSAWKAFHLYDVFEIDMGNKFDRGKMPIGDTVNFVGRTGLNNGVNAVCGHVDGVSPYASGLITLALGGTIGACFVQTEPFYTSQNVVVLIPPEHAGLYGRLFASSSIYASATSRYKAFSDELNRHVKSDFTFMLPATPDGAPDWAYMEQYMRDVMAVEALFADELDRLSRE